MCYKNVFAAIVLSSYLILILIKSNDNLRNIEYNRNTMKIYPTELYLVLKIIASHMASATLFREPMTEIYFACLITFDMKSHTVL